MKVNQSGWSVGREGDCVVKENRKDSPSWCDSVSCCPVQ